MTRLFNGIIHCTGEHDTGKTTFALECGADPARIWFADDDVKGRATVQDYRSSGEDFGAYVDLAALGKDKTMVELHDATMDLIEAIQPNQYDAIIWDTWTRFSKTFRHVVITHPNRFRKPKEWAPQGSIKGAEMNKEAQIYEARVINYLGTLAPTVILVTHLKAHYLNNAKTGKEVPAASRTLARVPRMRIWLRQNPDGRSVPIGLFLKRFDRKKKTDRGLRTVCIVPRKITPGYDDESLWDTIWRYWDEPFGRRVPEPHETPNAFELSILDGTLTVDQRRTLNLMLQAGAVQSYEEGTTTETSAPEPKPLNISADKVAAILAARNGDNPTPLPQLAKEHGLNVAQVMRVLKETE